MVASRIFAHVSILATISLVLSMGCMRGESPLSKPQQLIVASFDLEVDRVKELLAHGIDVNARMGEHDNKQFYDKWSLGWPVASNK